MRKASFQPWAKNKAGEYVNDVGEVIPGVTCRGMDVSCHQGKINWRCIHRLHRKGQLDFVIIRAGYGEDRVTQDDVQFRRNVDACIRYGIPFGVYLFSYADTREKAESEKQHVLRLVKDLPLTYPIYYDVEWTEGQSTLGAEFFSDIVDIFCGGLQALGYEVGLYSFRKWFQNPDTLGKIDYVGRGIHSWIAEFNDHLHYEGACEIWQCTSHGHLPGIEGRVDLSFSFMEKREVKK